MPYLHIRGADGSERIVPLKSGTMRLGRNPFNEVVLDDRDVSRQHAEILVGDGLLEVRDAGSTNGTWLKERRSRPRGGEEPREWIRLQRTTGSRAPYRAVIGVGDEMRLGNLRLHVVETPQVAPRLGDITAPPLAMLPPLPRSSPGELPATNHAAASLDLSSTHAVPPGLTPRALSERAARASLRRRREAAPMDEAT